jgi:hypothetical protein
MAVKVFLVWLALLCAAAAQTPQDAPMPAVPACADETALAARYDALELQYWAERDLPARDKLFVELQPIRVAITACTEAQWAANTVAFDQLGAELVAANRDLQIALREQKRFRREPWHREFWRRR